MTYHISIEEFEGPFDLLLFFIERDELDIYNIPIAKITHDFLDYLRRMEELDIDLASEFILVAATLVRIKAKMLLPRRELDEFGEEIDPRDDLVRKLLEYKRFKEVLGDFEALEEVQLMRERRGSAISELEKLGQKVLVEAELETISLYKLFEVFNDVMKNYEKRGKRVVHKVYKYPYRTDEIRNSITSSLKERKRIGFVELLAQAENRIHAIFNFLIVLEMINQSEIGIIAGKGFNSFWIVRK
ncbi:MAG: chromosome segregation protein ScpA [Saprospirales bacterium]|nr:MAG: chromosome segregation protein ScpA [Saprospirales bacterium]